MDRFIEQFSSNSGAYAPNLVGALVVLVLGLAASWLLAFIARRVFAHTTVDERITKLLRGDGATRVDSARWLSRGVFWIAVLVTLLAFFQALGFAPIAVPLSHAFDLFVGFLPRLLASVALGILAWIAASAVRLVVGRALEAAHLDDHVHRLAAPAAGAVAGERAPPRLSRALAQAGYWLVWLLFLPAILGALQLEGILAPVQDMVDKILAFLPNVFTAGLILVAAYFVGRIVAGLVTSVLVALGIDALAERAGIVRAKEATEGALQTSLPRFIPSRVAGTLALVVIMLFAAMEAFNVINFAQLSTMVDDIISLIGRVALGAIIFAVGVGLANLAARSMRTTSVGNPRILAPAVRVAIIVLAAAMALRQMGFANEIVNLAFGLLLGGVAAAIAIAFGVGGREVAGRELSRWVERAHARAVPIVPDDAAIPQSH